MYVIFEQRLERLRYLYLRIYYDMIRSSIIQIKQRNVIKLEEKPMAFLEREYIWFFMLSQVIK